jgi:hypothetical protein
MKTLELRINNGKPEVKIVKVMKVAEEIIQLETVQEYQMSILINKSRNLQAIHKNVRLVSYNNSLREVSFMNKEEMTLTEALLVSVSMAL